MTPTRLLSLATLGLLLANATQAAEVATRSERLWLPASASHLRPFLQMAADMALQDENCKEILYARLNEYRTIYEEPTFTVLCQKDPKSTFNRVIKITEVDPEYFDKIRASEDALNTNSTLSPEIEALRQQLSAPQSSAPANPAEPVQETPQSANPEQTTPQGTNIPPAANH